MTALAFIDRLRAEGITLTARGDRLHVAAPSGAATADLREELARRKAELLEALADDRDYGAGDPDDEGDAGGLVLALPDDDGPAIKAVLDDVDKLVISIVLGEVEAWQPTRPDVPVPGVPAGWEPDRWAARLRTLAAAKEKLEYALDRIP